MTSYDLWKLPCILLVGRCIISQSEVPAGNRVADVIEYCQWEYFNASCPDPNDVIVMRTARYGRMRFGRCMREDHGSVGCAADVLLHLDRKCSGRRSCQVTIPDATLHNIHPCPKELMPYLEASYSCVRVKPWTNQLCRTDGDDTETLESGILLPTMSSEIQYSGHVNCPWIVRTKPGRRINLTLYSFPAEGGGVSAGDVLSGGACAIRIVIEDRNRTTTTELCADGGGGGGGRQRQKQIYSSEGSLVKVYVQQSGDADDAVVDATARFLLNYQAFDCADIVGMSNAWVRRNGDNVIVRCNFTAETFFLTCRNSHWRGQLYNCSDGRTAGYHGSALYTYGILAVIGLSVSLGVAAGVVLLFSVVVCLRRRSRKRRKKDFCHHGSEQQHPTDHPLLGRPHSNHQRRPIDVQSIDLPDCRAYRPYDLACYPRSIGRSMSCSSSHKSDSCRSPVDQARLRDAVNCGLIGGPPHPHLTPDSNLGGCASSSSSLMERRQGGDSVPTERGANGAVYSSFFTLLSPPPEMSTTSGGPSAAPYVCSVREGRYSDPVHPPPPPPPKTDLNDIDVGGGGGGGSETKALDLLKDFARLDRRDGNEELDTAAQGQGQGHSQRYSIECTCSHAT